MSYGLEWIPGPLFLGVVLFLPFVPGLALIAVLLLALAAVAALLALAAAVVASPYLLARVVRRHLEERHEATQGPVPIATPQVG
jgi:membrane protein implicated in regulation of membrane protease activity